MKKIVIVLILITLLTSCTGKGREKVVFKDYDDLKDINYTLSKNNLSNDLDEVNLSLYPVKNFNIGDEVTATVNLNTQLSSKNPYFYVIVDWGDGRWSHEGPYISTSEKQSTAILKHKYVKSGEYEVRAGAIDLEVGEFYGWSESDFYVISGGTYTRNLIKNLAPIYSTSGDKQNIESILDNNTQTYFETGEAKELDDTQYIGYLFKEMYRLDQIEIQFPEVDARFPSNIAIEYTTDHGKTWYSLPKYYYLYDYSIGRYQPIMNFPNPQGATLSLDLDGIVANGIRISAKLFLTEPRVLSVSELRVYGDEELLFYTNKGGTFDADLNNMWTIFGTAKTEPIVYGSMTASNTNQSPFRTGFTLIASTEWAEWNSLKLSWTDFDEAKDVLLNQLINIRYGPDGWSDDNGYIYATADSPKHLGEQRHYTLNPIFIMAARDYLMQANNTSVYQDGEYVSFLESKNSLGQSMIDKIEKSMSYMLNTLDGKSGVMTIFDPENDGTQNGNASNYWDAIRAFGFKSSYENTLFYASLFAMADIKMYLNDPEGAMYYYDLAEKVKVEFNKLFWDNQKGRYITSVNSRGEKLDFGLTFVNYYAATFGLASEEQAKLIYDWIEGKRIIEGDKSQGKDIYGAFKYASRTGTVDFSSTGAPYYWWDHGGALPPTPGTFGGFNHQMQNGGTIFYISYYDMMGRINTLGADSAFTRFEIILDEFHKDSLRRNDYMSYVQDGQQGVGEYREGVLGEFPESGLVPLTFLKGFLGITPTSEGLLIDANLPKDLNFAGIRKYLYGNRVYSIQVSKDITKPELQFDGEKYFVKVPANEKYVITPDNRLVKKRSNSK